MLELVGPEHQDSEDLEEGEVASAYSTRDGRDLLGFAMEAHCPQCGGKEKVRGYKLRRKAGHLYWRLSLVCPQNHERTSLVQVDWLL